MFRFGEINSRNIGPSVSTRTVGRIREFVIVVMEIVADKFKPSIVGVESRVQIFPFHQ